MVNANSYEKNTLNIEFANCANAFGTISNCPCYFRGIYLKKMPGSCLCFSTIYFWKVVNQIKQYDFARSESEAEM